MKLNLGLINAAFGTVGEGELPQNTVVLAATLHLLGNAEEPETKRLLEPERREVTTLLPGKIMSRWPRALGEPNEQTHQQLSQAMGALKMEWPQTKAALEKIVGWQDREANFLDALDLQCGRQPEVRLLTSQVRFLKAVIQQGLSPEAGQLDNFEEISLEELAAKFERGTGAVHPGSRP